MEADARVRYLRYSNKPRATARIGPAYERTKAPRPLSMLALAYYAAITLGGVTVGWGLAHLPHPW